MTRGDELRLEIENSGVSITFLAYRMKCSRNRIYAIIGGADCTATEIAQLTELLHLSKVRRDYIFLNENVN